MTVWLRPLLAGLVALGGACSPATSVGPEREGGSQSPADSGPAEGVDVASGGPAAAVADSSPSSNETPAPVDAGVPPWDDDAHAAGGNAASPASDAGGPTEAAPPAPDAAPATPEAGSDDASSGPLFHEDFERGAIDPSVWATQTSGGQTPGTVQTAIVAHGKYAVQFHANPSVVSYDFIITKSAPAGLRGHHFGRAYFFISPKPPDQHTEFLFAGTSGFPKLKYIEVAGIGTGWQLTYVDLTAAAAVETYASGGSTPLVRWFCLEWEFNDTPDQATVFVDGAQSYTFPNIASGGKTTALVGGFTDFGFGYYAWHPATYAFDVYYDDIALDTKRVGCLP